MSEEQRQELDRIMQELTRNSYDAGFRSGVKTILEILNIKWEEPAQ